MPLKSNYGGILQFVALQEVLVDLEFYPILLNRQYAEPFWKVILKKYLFELVFENSLVSFKKKYTIQTTKPLRNDNDLKKKIEELDLFAVVVGSDQVWRKEYVEGFYKNYFLNIIKDSSLIKIAYAVSFGKDEWEKSIDDKEISKLLAKFKAISVREESGIDICKKKFGRNDVELALDPTLLVKRSFFDRITDNINISCDEYIYSYILDIGALSSQVFRIVKEEFNLNIKSTKSDGILNKICRFEKKISIEEWLVGFRDSRFVITDSYHGTIMAIIYKKPFITLENSKRGSVRFHSLLNQLGLSNRIVKDVNNFSLGILSGEIDYVEVYDRLQNLRLNSYYFLQNNLREGIKDD